MNQTKEEQCEAKICEVKFSSNSDKENFYVQVLVEYENGKEIEYRIKTRKVAKGKIKTIKNFLIGKKLSEEEIKAYLKKSFPFRKCEVVKREKR